VDDATGLRRLAADYQSHLVGTPGLDLVPLQWLHVTMQNVGLTDEVSDAEIQAVAKAGVTAAPIWFLSISPLVQ
jgi:hypothetical protein